MLWLHGIGHDDLDNLAIGYFDVYVYIICVYVLYARKKGKKNIKKTRRLVTSIVESLRTYIEGNVFGRWFDDQGIEREQRENEG